MATLLKGLPQFPDYLLSDWAAMSPLVLCDLRCEVDYVGRGERLSR